MSLIQFLFKGFCKKSMVIPALFLLTLIFFVPSCTSKKSAHAIPISKEERVWLEEFFRDLLFKETGVFTLCGTKPVSLCHVYKNKHPITQEEEERLRKEGLDAQPRRYNFDENYEKWLKIKDRFQIRQYLFGAFPEPFVAEGDKIETILFVNIEMTLRTLIAYYDNFRRLLGYDFDPFEVVFEVENRDSPFWNAVLKEHVLTGILVGYGLDDPWFFQWSMQYKDASGKPGEFIRTLPSGFDTDEEIQHYNAQNFLLPTYRVYGIHQGKEPLQSYKTEREHIKQIYKGKDEVDTTLEWLTR